MTSGIESRLEELESRLAFQDDLIDSLNEIVVRQDRELARLELRVKSLGGKLEELSDVTSAPGSAQGHEVPPHY
jgi:SlyX protein